MNKLSQKVFVTILVILSIINVSLLVFFNVYTYSNIRNEVKNSLNPKPIHNERLFKPDTYELSNRNGHVEIVKTIADENVTSVFDKMLNEVSKNDKRQKPEIGNLYFEDYSFAIRNNSLEVIDNRNFRNFLLRTLFGSIMLAAIFELLIVFISKRLTKWIVNPVKKSFDDQNRFIEDASHELKTPLAVIVASIDAYEKDKDEKWIKNIKDESGRMSELVKGLLDLLELENDITVNKSDDFEKLDLSNLIESQILTCESLFYESDIKLKYDVEDDIEYKCNEGQIKQLVHILLDNAIKHSKNLEEDKDRKVKINLLKDSSSNKIVFTVTNKGVKMDKEECEKIFDRFYKKEKSRNRDDGNYGLGLAIAKSIVENNNGQISCECKSGYITFKVEFDI